MTHYEDDIKQALTIYKRRLSRFDMELAKHKRRTYATMGLWLPVWAFHWFRLCQARSTTKHLVDALEFGVNAGEVM